MEALISQVKLMLGPVLGSIGLLGAILFGTWIKKINDQKKRNAFNELDLATRKISFDIKSKPIDDLVSESNKSHRADDLGDSTGVDPKKK